MSAALFIEDFNADGGLMITAATGVLLCSVVTLTGTSHVGFFTRLSAITFSSLPYIIAFALGKRLLTSRRLKIATSGGLVIYTVLDLMVRYQAFFNATRSTAGVAVVLLMVASVLIIPAGAAITYLFLLLLGVGEHQG
ncbi:MAG: hypothetical protein ABR563_07750 [Pyrinomonadaceae bacterium]